VIPVTPSFRCSVLHDLKWIPISWFPWLNDVNSTVAVRAEVRLLSGWTGRLRVTVFLILKVLNVRIDRTSLCNSGSVSCSGFWVIELSNVVKGVWLCMNCVLELYNVNVLRGWPVEGVRGTVEVLGVHSFQGGVLTIVFSVVCCRGGRILVFLVCAVRILTTRRFNLK